MLTRGPLLPLLIAPAMDYPPVQVMLVVIVLVMFSDRRSPCSELPLLDVIDCVMFICIVLMESSIALSCWL